MTVTVKYNKPISVTKKEKTDVKLNVNGQNANRIEINLKKTLPIDL